MDGVVAWGGGIVWFVLTCGHRAGRGLGFNMAQALAEVGVRGIAILDVQRDIGEEAARSLQTQTGVDARFYGVDVRDAAGVRQTVEDVMGHFGALDVLINAAGIAEWVSLFSDLSFRPRTDGIPAAPTSKPSITTSSSSAACSTST